MKSKRMIALLSVVILASVVLGAACMISGCAVEKANPNPLDVPGEKFTDNPYSFDIPNERTRARAWQDAQLRAGVINDSPE
jgi:hypothetical protein